MAVVPSLAAMAALTLFQNPHMQPEGYSVDYSAYSAPATVIQRRQRRRIGAVTRIAAAGDALRAAGPSVSAAPRTNIPANWPLTMVAYLGVSACVHPKCFLHLHTLLPFLNAHTRRHAQDTPSISTSLRLNLDRPT